jgi:hypothetical protein
MIRSKKAPLLKQAADVLRRARKLPVGAARNDLRQLAQGLMNLYRAGLRANVQIIEQSKRPDTHKLISLEICHERFSHFR